MCAPVEPIELAPTKRANQTLCRTLPNIVLSWHSPDGLLAPKPPALLYRAPTPQSQALSIINQDSWPGVGFLPVQRLIAVTGQLSQLVITRIIKACKLVLLTRRNTMQ